MANDTHPIHDELHEMRQMIRSAREQFRADAHAVLDEASAKVDSFALAVGDVSADIALDGFRRWVDERFQERLR